MYLHYLLFGSISIAIASIFDRIILQEVSVATFLFFVYAFLVINYIPIYIFLHKEPIKKAIENIKAEFGWSFLFSFTRLISVVFFAYAIALVNIGLATSLRRMSTFFSVFLGGKIFKEDHLKWKLFASALMIIGAFLIIF